MTGPEHYREAERLIGEVTQPGVMSGKPILKIGDNSQVIALAQVHATLAHAAAEAEALPAYQIWPEVTRLCGPT